MSLTIDLGPDEERELRHIAASANLDAEAYAAQLLRRMLSDEIVMDQVQRRALAGDPLSDDVRERIRRMHDDIRALGLKDVPFYSDEVMTREWIYGDHL